ncbi:MAG: hypothetical protein LBU04_07315 [Christensenellaceae bacterium]|jgi:hypothetical protein|nr:hypothetical protein [Christensenellaceae bacterium]
MASEGNVMMYLDKWCESTVMPYDDILISSRQASDMFSSIAEDGINTFNKNWISHRQEQEYIYYDSVAISSNAKKIPRLARGNNPHRSLDPQLKNALYIFSNKFSRCESINSLCSGERHSL